jgi:hypothetical protein
MFAVAAVIFLAPVPDTDGLGVELLEKLGDRIGILPAVSPDGKLILYFKEGEKAVRRATFTYMLADADGKQPRELFRSPIDFDDVLVGMVGQGTFSADGKSVAIVTTDDGKPLDSQLHRLRPGVCTLDGKVQTIGVEGGLTGIAFAENRLLFLDCGAFDRNNAKAGYKLKVWDGKAATVVHEDTAAGAAVLRSSPDGSKAAFFLIDLPRGKEKEAFRLRVVDLKAKTAVTSDAFDTDDFFFDGAPLFYWSADGASLFYHVRKSDAVGRDFVTTRFDLKSKQSSRVGKADNMAVFAVLDEKHLAVALMKEQKVGVFRLTDDKFLPLPEGQIILGGSGSRVVVADQKTRALYAAKLQFPGK